MHSFTLEKSIQILERTPVALDFFLRGISDGWVMTNEGGESWSAYDIIGHFIHGEQTDWIQRLEIILSNKSERTFKPFDRFAQFQESKGKTMNDLLDEFKILRAKNLAILKSKNLTEADLKRTGIHPALGEVTLRNLLSTWTTHDLNHLAQLARVMAYQYKEDVGPWYEYLPILHPRKAN